MWRSGHLPAPLDAALHTEHGQTRQVRGGGEQAEVGVDFTVPRTRARRPPCRRRMRWASLRSTLGRVAR